MRFLLTSIFFVLFSVSANAQNPKLDKLADHLQKLNPQRFTMRQWGNMDDSSDPQFYGCAAGYATGIVEFRKQGLRLKNVDGCHHIMYKDFYDYEACAAFFEIPKEEATLLFGNNTRNVTKEIEQLRIVSKRTVPLAITYAFGW